MKTFLKRNLIFLKKGIAFSREIGYRIGNEARAYPILIIMNEDVP